MSDGIMVLVQLARGPALLRMAPLMIVVVLQQVITPLLKVLRSLHQLGIVHRDIKPENIFFQADGTLRLGDFGLAINATKERPISRVGTLEYMSPEVSYNCCHSCGTQWNGARRTWDKVAACCLLLEQRML